MTTPGTIQLPPLRAAHKQHAVPFVWALDGSDREGWDALCRAATDGTGRWSARSADGARITALVLVFEGLEGRKAGEELLGGDGHVRAGSWKETQWTGELAHVAARVDAGWMAILPLTYPVDVSTDAARRGWQHAAGLAAEWVSRRTGGPVRVAGVDETWALPLAGAEARPGSACVVEGMQLSRPGKKGVVVIKVESIQEVPVEYGGTRRVKLQVGPMAWHLTPDEAGSLLEQLRDVLDDGAGPAKKAAKKAPAKKPAKKAPAKKPAKKAPAKKAGRA